MSDSIRQLRRCAMDSRALTRTAGALGLALVTTLLLGGCGGGVGSADEEPAAMDATEASVPNDAGAGGTETLGDLWAEIEAKEAETREAAGAPELDVCGLLDTDALIAVMPETNYNPVTARSDTNMLGPVCRFSGGKGGENLTANVEASSLSVTEVLGTYQDAPDLPEVGAGVRYFFNPNYTDRRSYVFEARGLTFKVMTMYSDEASSREFTRRAVSMIRR